MITLKRIDGIYIVTTVGKGQTYYSRTLRKALEFIQMANNRNG